MADTGKNRRQFLGFFTSLLIAFIGALVAAPALAYFFAPLRRRTGGNIGEPSFRDVGLLSDIPIGQWHLLALDVIRQDGWKKTRAQYSVWVRRQGEGKEGITVFSPICPHLGCPVNWHPEQKEFMCPCHGGTFDANGRHIAGPPPRSLDPLEFEIRDGRLLVRWQDFRIGVVDRIPVSV